MYLWFRTTGLARCIQKHTHTTVMLEMLENLGWSLSVRNHEAVWVAQCHSFLLDMWTKTNPLCASWTLKLRTIVQFGAVVSANRMCACVCACAIHHTGRQDFVQTPHVGLVFTFLGKTLFSFILFYPRKQTRMGILKEPALQEEGVAKTWLKTPFFNNKKGGRCTGCERAILRRAKP